MKLAADEHIPFRSIRLLRDAGFDVLSIREDHPGLDDELILELADKQGRVVLTCDADFGQLIFEKKAEFSAGLIYFRLGHFRPDEIADLVLEYVGLGVELERRFTVLSRNKFRQRNL